MVEVITDEMIEKVQKGTMQMSEAKAIAMAGELFKRQRFAQAEQVCRQIIQHKPANAEAHNILGVSLSAMGKGKEAIESLKRATKLAPKIASFHANLGEVQRASGNLADAVVTLLEAVRLDPNNAQAQNNLGIVHFERKQYQQAVECYRKALGLSAAFPEAHNNLGNALRMSGEYEDAQAEYQQALLHRENYPEAYNNLGCLLRETHKTGQAEHALRKAIAQNPRYADAYNNLGALHHAEGKDVEALRQMSEVLKFAPRNATSLILTARIQLKRGAHEQAERAVRTVLEDDPSNAEALTVLGQVLHEIDIYDEAVEVLEKALSVSPENPEALNFYGVALKSVGRLDEARTHILRAVEINSGMFGAYANLNDLVDFSTEPELFEQIEAIMDAAENTETEQFLPLHFAYAKALDDRGQHERALEHFVIGGRLKRAQLHYAEDDAFAFFDAIEKAFPHELFTNRPYKGHGGDNLIFIVGMPRSGSTLVEQILSSHSDVFGAGEVKYLSRALNGLRDRFPSLSTYPDMIGELSDGQYEIIAKRYINDITAMSEGAGKITDKLLTNYFFIGLINVLFPKAKIVHTVRSPLDTCLSAFTKLFKDDMPHSYDLGEIGRYYQRYQRLMEHWARVLPKGVMTTAVYEEMVKDTEKTARGLLKFLGLPWQDSCLSFHESNRPVKTASVAQIRKPIYQSSMERWKRYGAGLKPLIDAIGQTEQGSRSRKSSK